MKEVMNELGFVEQVMEVFEDHHIVQGCAKLEITTDELLALMEKHEKLKAFMHTRFEGFDFEALKTTGKEQGKAPKGSPKNTSKQSSKKSGKKEVSDEVPEGTIGESEGETEGDAEHNDSPAEGNDPSSAE